MDSAPHDDLEARAASRVRLGSRGPRRAAWLAAVVFVIECTGSARADIVRHGPPACPAIALTFDLCPVGRGPGLDRPLVDLLESRRVPATFFVSGAWMRAHEPELRELLSVPFFEIGTHGDRHLSLPRLGPAAARQEITGPVRTLEAAHRRGAPLFRPPYGDFTDETVRIAESEGLTCVLWSVVSGDPDPRLSAAAILDDVEGRLKAGSIVVFHANGRGCHTFEVVDALLPWLPSARGLKPVTVSQLLAGCGRD